MGWGFSGRGGRARRVALGPTWGLCFIACIAIIAKMHLNRVEKPVLMYLRLIARMAAGWSTPDLENRRWHTRAGATFSMYKYSLGFAGPLSRSGTGN